MLVIILNNYFILMNYNYILYAAKIESVIGSTCATIKTTHQNSSINLDTQDLSRLSQRWETDKIECCLNDKVPSKNTLARSYKKRSFFLQPCKILQDLVRSCGIKIFKIL